MGLRFYILIFISLILVGCSSQSNINSSKLEIYTDSYYSIKEGYYDNIPDFLTKEYDYKIEFKNDSIIELFYQAFKKIKNRNKFKPGQTKTVYLLDYNGVKDTLFLNRGDTRYVEFTELILLTNNYFLTSNKIR